MEDNTIVIHTKIDNVPLDETIEKLNQIKSLLLEIKDLSGTVNQGCDIKINLGGKVLAKGFLKGISSQLQDW